MKAPLDKTPPGPGWPLRGIIWFTLAVICVCAVVLFAEYIEKARTLEVISRRVQAMMLGF